MTKYKQTFKKHRKYKIHTAVETNKTHVYRYMSYSTFIRCLLSGAFRFSEPSQWPDKFESRFYNAIYTPPKKDIIPYKVYAFCTTAKRDSEPSWLMYAANEPTIQIKIKRLKWLESLHNWNKKNGTNQFEIYEAPVNYDLKESHIANIHKPKSNLNGVTRDMTGHKELFDNFDLDSYLSLLLLKRKAYSYEDEIRYMIVQQDEEKKDSKDEKYLDVPIFDLDFIEEIRFSSQLSLCQLCKILTIFEGKGWVQQQTGIEKVILKKDNKVIPLCAFDISEGTYADFSKPITI
jgi:hypothetical protein